MLFLAGGPATEAPGFVRLDAGVRYTRAVVYETARSGEIGNKTPSGIINDVPRIRAALRQKTTTTHDGVEQLQLFWWEVLRV